MRLVGQRPFRCEWKAVLIALVVAVTAAVVSASQLYVNWSRFEEGVSFPGLLLVKLVEWTLWAGVVPLILVLDRRAGFQARKWTRAVPVHLAAATSWFLVHNAVVVLLAVHMGHQDGGGADVLAKLYLDRIFFKLPTSLLVYGFVLLVFWLNHLATHRHQEEMRRVRLEAELTDAQLHNLKMQLHPHFLFNTMNTIAGLIREGERAEAVEVMSELCDLLRRSLQDVELQEVPLADELDFLRRYLRIQHIRFGDRLHTQVRVDDGVHEALVPNLLLQPLVENAIRHGLDLATEPGQVQVSARREADSLVLEVRDNGQGVRDLSGAEGIGLGTTRRRLAHLYGVGQQLTILPAQPRGTVVRIRIPIRHDTGVSWSPPPPRPLHHA